MDMEGDIESGAEVCDVSLVGVGFGSAKAVVDVHGGKTCAEGVAFCVVCGVQGEEEGDGVCSARDGGAETIAGFDVFAVEGERRNRWHG